MVDRGEKVLGGGIFVYVSLQWGRGWLTAESVA